MHMDETHDTHPLGVPLGDLGDLLEAASIPVERRDRVLIARHHPYTTQVEVVPPDADASGGEDVQAVVRVVTELPAMVQTVVNRHPEVACAAFNPLASLGALHEDAKGLVVGSRLTIYQGEDAWRTLQLPMLMFSVLCAAPALVGGMGRALRHQPVRGGESSWTERDLVQAEGLLSSLCVCTLGGLGLTAEFGLREGEASAVIGDSHTALFQLHAGQPHPQLGAGLFSLLQMPHQAADEAQVAQVCEQLNRMEMQAEDLPPHFGAWCPGRLGHNLAYVSFLPNAMHAISGVAANLGVWALHRARWAAAMMPALGASG